MVTIDRIRYFLSTAETLSFSQAAKACFVSQTAISQQIAQMEKELGVSLFIRQNKSIRLTPAGKHLYPMAKKLFDEYVAMITDMRHTFAHSERITLAVSGNFEAQLLTFAIPAFRKKHPDTVVVSKNVNLENVARTFEVGECDLAFAITGEIEPKDVIAAEVIRGHMGIGVSVNNPLASRAALSSAELLHHPLVLFRCKPGLKCAAVMHDWVLSLGYREKDILWADTVEEQQFMVSVDQCISILPDSILCPGVRVVPISDLEIPYSISTYYHRHTKELDDLVSLLKEAGDIIAGND